MSSESIHSNKRIAQNMILLYVRQIIVMFVSLYTSRIVLEVLGVENYGIYSVVGGLVAMFSVLSGSLTAAIGRFITYELGKGEKGRLCTVFSTSLNVQFILSFLVIILMLTVGRWFLNERMTIPTERLATANVVLYVSMFTFLVNLISVPYNAMIVAHERMNVFAYVSLLEVLLKLGLVYLLRLLSGDSLVNYVWLIFVVAMLIRVVYGLYCRVQFSECRYECRLDGKLLKEMLAFSGWNFIGSSSTILKNYGVDIVLNLFHGTAINAARGVAMQVNNAVNSFVGNFFMAVSPQLTKSYAAGDLPYVRKLSYASSKYGFYLLLLLSTPFVFETHKILSIWLVEVPEYAVVFVRLLLIDTLITSLSQPMIIVMLATGKIKWYQIVVGGINMLNVPLSYILLKNNYSPEVVLYVAICLSVLCLIARIFFLRVLAQFSVSIFVRDVLSRVFFVSLFSSITPYLLCYKLDAGNLRLFLIVLLGSLMTLLSVYFLGINRLERQFVVNKLKFILFRKG